MSWRSTPRFEVAAFGIASHLLLTPFGYPRLMYLMTNNRDGAVYHAYSAYARGVDGLWGT